MNTELAEAFERMEAACDRIDAVLTEALEDELEFVAERGED